MKEQNQQKPNDSKIKKILESLDMFGVSKVNVEDGDMSYRSCLGGFLTLLFIFGAITIVLYYLVVFFTNPSVTVTQQQIASQNQVLVDLTTDYNYSLGVNITMNSKQFDFAIFFPEIYNSTLDTLFAGKFYNPMANVGINQDNTCKQPFYLALSHFSAIVVGDLSKPQQTTNTVPMQFLGTTTYQSINGRLYGAYFLDKALFGPNSQIDIILELSKSTTGYSVDFTTIGQSSTINQVYFLYREYTYDTTNMKPSSKISSYQFDFYPAGISGIDVNQCNRILISTGIVQAIETKNFKNPFSIMQKFAGWNIDSRPYYYSSLYGQCPSSSSISFNNGLTPFAPVNCISPKVPYQPFRITIKNSKTKTTYNITYDNGALLFSLIGGAISLLLSVMSGFATSLNQKFYVKSVKDEIKSNIKNTKLKDMDISTLNPEQKNGLLFTISKTREEKRKKSLVNLKESDAELDQLIWQENTKYLDTHGNSLQLQVQDMLICNKDGIINTDMKKGQSERQCRTPEIIQVKVK